LKFYAAKVQIFSLKSNFFWSKITKKGQNRFKMRDLWFKMRQITHFKPQKTMIEPLFAKVAISLHQKRFLMVKVYG